MAREISNSDSVIDSRDVIARIKELEELESEVSSAQDTADEARSVYKEADENGAVDAVEALEKAEADLKTAQEWFGEELQEELRILREFAEEAEGYCPDWKHGETLIRDDYFETYARELAEDLGALENCNHWPATCIDWEKAARELQMDYSSAEFDGVTYWFR